MYPSLKRKKLKKLDSSDDDEWLVRRYYFAALKIFFILFLHADPSPLVKGQEEKK